MPYEPALPAEQLPLNASPMRAQFTGRQTNIQAKASEDDCMGRLGLTAQNPSAVELLEVNTADLPPLAAKLNELITALKR